jgi:hypothetical protein
MLEEPSSPPIRSKRANWVGLGDDAPLVEPDINLSGGEALVQMGALGLRWYQTDIGWYFIWMLEAVGLAHSVKRPRAS